MVTYPICDGDGRTLAFEVPNLCIDRAAVCNVVRSIPQGEVIREPKRFLSWLREDIFCEFVVNGIVFEAEEPYGDNSRYWIGPRHEGENGLRWYPETELVHDAFRRA